VAVPRVPVAKAGQAYLEQWSSVRDWVGGLPPAAWEDASAVDGWQVVDLVAHLGLVATSVASALGSPTREPPLGLADYLGRYVDAAASIDARTRQVGAGSPADVLAVLDAAGTAAETAVEALVAGGGDPVVAAGRGPVRASDHLVSRCVELVVHSDDLARSTAAAGPGLRRPALQLAVRGLAGVLEERAPGRSVEVRVPPFAAVQCVAGPRHTRGTPPAVVETDPMTFLRVASGRLTWDEAHRSGTVLVSGLRTDLSAWFPLLR
jgi:uncharacterized protein (TIGR03083 family)